MRALFIYNPHDANELALLDRAKSELANYIVEFTDFESAKDRYQIAQTPALILIRDDLQGAQLLTETGDAKLRVTAELWSAIQSEELVIHGAETHRIDNIILAEKTAAIDDYTLSLIDGGLI